MKSEAVDKILSRFGVTEQIGAAAFGKVYRGQIGNRQVAIKLEPANTESEEHLHLAKIRELRAEAPPEVLRHLPEVYEIQTQDGVNVYVIELLAKPDAATIEHIFGTSVENIDEDSLWNHIVDGQSVEPARAATINFADDRWTDQQMLDEVWNIWSSRQLKGADPAVAERGMADLRSAVMSTIGLLWKSAKPVTVAELTAAVAAACKTPEGASMAPQTSAFFLAAAAATHIPAYDPNKVGASYFTMSLKDQPESVKSLMNTLSWLRSKGLSWGDVHAGNIMMRPSTRDLVFIDFGLYSQLTQPRQTDPDAPTAAGRRR